MQTHLFPVTYQDSYYNALFDENEDYLTMLVFEKATNEVPVEKLPCLYRMIELTMSCTLLSAVAMPSSYSAGRRDHSQIKRVRQLHG